MIPSATKAAPTGTPPAEWRSGIAVSVTVFMPPFYPPSHPRSWQGGQGSAQSEGLVGASGRDFVFSAGLHVRGRRPRDRHADPTTFRAQGLRCVDAVDLPAFPH